jgi:hypothetical protein
MGVWQSTCKETQEPKEGIYQGRVLWKKKRKEDEEGRERVYIFFGSVPKFPFKIFAIRMLSLDYIGIG